MVAVVVSVGVMIGMIVVAVVVSVGVMIGMIVVAVVASAHATTIATKNSRWLEAD